MARFRRSRRKSFGRKRKGVRRLRRGLKVKNPYGRRVGIRM